MDKSTNLTRLKIQSKAEELLLQWPRFDEKFYLQSELGRAEASFNEVFNGAVGYPSIWDSTIEPGKAANTSIDLFRSLNLSSLDFANALEVQHINFFPFSLLKNGSAFAENDSSLYDVSTCNNVIFEKLQSFYLHAPHVIFNASLFKNCHLKFFHGYQSLFKATTIEDSVFDQGYWNNFGSGSDIKTWTELIIRRSKFQSAVIPRIYMTGTIIEDSDFNSCNWRQYDALTDQATPTILRSNFQFSLLSIRTSDNGHLEGNNFYSCAIGDDYNKIAGWIISNNFERSTIAKATLGGYLKNNNFRHVTFTGTLTFQAFSDISGCDFTGSNIDSFYATKALLRAAVNNRYDSSTLWIDGTPL